MFQSILPFIAAVIFIEGRLGFKCFQLFLPFVGAIIIIECQLGGLQLISFFHAELKMEVG